MDPSSNNSSSTDNSYDYFIAFLVLLGALTFILKQSFPDKSPVVARKNSKQLTPYATKPVVPATKETAISLYAQHKAEEEFAEEAIQEWTEDLSDKAIYNTPFHTPQTNHTHDLVQKDTLNATIATEQQKIGTTIVKEQIDTINTAPTFNIEKQVQTPTIPSGTKTKNSKTKNKFTQETTPTITSRSTSKSIETPLVESYEAASPSIRVNGDDLVEKGGVAASKKRSVAPSKQKNTCVIVVAALQEAANVKRLVRALETENYEVYNRQSGNYRAIGVRTSCRPAVYQPLLKKLRRDYAKSAWLIKQ